MDNTFYSHYSAVYVFLWILRTISTTTEACAIFQFPTLHDKKIIVSENSSVSFTFLLNVKSCGSNYKNADIHVEDNTSRHCHVRLQDKKCYVTVDDSLCSCVSASGPFMFTKIIKRSDNALWTWSAYNDYLQLIAEDSISFIITYPAHVTSLTVNEHVNPRTVQVIRNQTVHVVCTWEDGNPSVGIYLLDKNRNILVSKSSGNGNIHHTYRAIGCHDAGAISCEANRSKKNLTTKLLVECPADFGNNSLPKLIALYGHKVQVRLPVKMHSSNIIACQIKKQHNDETMLRSETVNYVCLIHACRRNSGQVSKSSQEKCCCFVNGTEPDLNLNVEILNVSQHDTGHWTVELTNQVGRNQTDFFVEVTQVPPSVTSLTVNGHYGQDPLLVIRKQSVKVVCAWENGNPPDRVRIMDREDRVLQSASYNNRIMHHDFPAVDCNDAGVIRCEADGSTRNMSAILLVECPPNFVYTSTETFSLNGHNHILHFPIRTHTADISECQISRRSEAATYLTLICGIPQIKPIQSHKRLEDRCICTVNGTAPDLNLYIQLFHVKEQDSGLWRLELKNKVGSDNAAFFLHVKAEEHTNGFGLKGISVIAGCLTAVIVISIIVAVVCIKRAGRTTYEQPKRVRHQEMDVYQCPALDAEVTSCSQTNVSQIYEEIQEKVDVKGECIIEIVYGYRTWVLTEADIAVMKSIQIEGARRDDFNSMKMELDISYEISESLQPCNISTSTHSSGSDKPYYLKPV